MKIIRTCSGKIESPAELFARWQRVTKYLKKSKAIKIKKVK
jgi:hypothetical protein